MYKFLPTNTHKLPYWSFKTLFMTAFILVINIIASPFNITYANTEVVQEAAQNSNSPEIDPLTRKFILEAKKIGVPEITGYRLSNPWQIGGKYLIAYQNTILIEEEDGTIKSLFNEKIKLIPTKNKVDKSNSNKSKSVKLVKDLTIINRQHPKENLTDIRTLFEILHFNSTTLSLWQRLDEPESSHLGEKAQELNLIPEDKLLENPTQDEGVNEDPPVIQPETFVDPPINTPQTQPIAKQLPKTLPPSASTGQVAGVWQGVASWYSRSGCVGCSTNLRMANGEPLNDFAFTIAFNHAPLNSTVRVTNVNNGQSIVARVTDTGGFNNLGRIADLTPAVRDAIGGSSLTPVRIELLI